MFRSASYRYFHPNPIYIFDAFTDTDGINATSHTGDINSTWINGINQNSGADAKIFSNVLTKDNSANAAVIYTGATPSNNCAVQAKIKMMTSISTGASLLARLNTASDDYYWLRHNRDLNQWQLRVTVGGIGSTLNGGAAVYSDTMNAGDERIAKLEVIGTSIKAYIDGVERISATDSSHSSGRAGIRFNGAASSTTGYSIDDFTVYNL
jgi:mannan endo-1,4-beta-mannosidase